MSNAFKPTKIGGLVFCPEVTQGTANWNLTADGGVNTTTKILVDTTSGATHNDNLAAMADGDFDYLYVYFYSNTATAALQGKVYPLALTTISLGVVTLNVGETMAAAPAGTETFILFGVVQSSDVSVSVGYENLPRAEFERQTLDMPSSNKGLKTATGSFKFELPGLTQENGNGDTPRLDVYSHLLRAFGARSAPAGTLVIANAGTSPANSTTTVNVTAGSLPSVGDWVMINNEAAKVIAVYDVDPADTDYMTISPALSATPSPTDEVFMGETFTPDDTGHQSHTFLYFQDVQLVECQGCVCSFGVFGTFGKNVEASCEFDGEAWDMQDSFTFDFEQTAKKTLPFVAGSSNFNSTALALNSFEFTLGHGRQQLRDTSASQRQFITTRDSTLKLVYRNQSLAPKETWEANGTHALATVQVGNAVTAAIAIGGKAQIQDPAESTDVEGHRYYDATFAIRDDQTDSNNPEKAQLVRF